jgi:hypothetical protein
MARPKRAARLDGAEDPVLLARLIDDAVALYRARFPEDWGACQNWPLQHGLAHVAAKLRSLGAGSGRGPEGR